MSMPPVSLPSLRFQQVGPMGVRLQPQFPTSSNSILSPERHDALPTLSKRLCQRPDDAMPRGRHNSTSSQPQQREPELAWRSALTPDQSAALAIARRETGYSSATSDNSSNLKGMWHSPPAGASAAATEDWKKARRKEQCRINQANYRKRKRQYEQQLVGEIKVLEYDIDQLETHRAVGVQGRQNPIQSIGDFYYAVGVEGEQRCVDLQLCSLADGSSPALQCLLDLQREEFDSIESLKLHWLWYREQFRIFQLSIGSCERLEVGEHVVIKITGQLQLDVYYDDEQRGDDCQGYGAITCPIVQHFEFETGEEVISRITSEVDLVVGVAAAQDQSKPDCTLSVLRCLSEGFTMSNRYHNN
jgi:hypothetical protein